MSSGDGLRLAVVESDDDLIQLFADIFADAGFRVTVASAPEYLPENWAGDVVVTDSGSFPYRREAVARRVRLLREASGASIVLVSAHEEAARDARELGVDAFVAKPFEIEQLITAIRSVTAKRGD